MGLLSRLKGLGLFLKDPAGWSAQWYRRKNRYDSVALHPLDWREEAAGERGQVVPGPGGDTGSPGDCSAPGE